MRRPGIEPGPRAWKARILTIELSTLNYLLIYIYINKKLFIFFINKYMK